MTTTYNFKYSALATTNLLNLTAYGGYYGVAGEGGTVDVSGTSTLITDASANSQEIDDIVAFVNNLPLSGSPTSISGSDQVLEPYPAHYTVGTLTGSLTFNATSSSDTFFISGFMNLSQVTSFNLGVTNPYNIYFMALGNSIYLAYNTKTPNYGNFIAEYVLATAQDDTALGTNCDATVFGTVTGTITCGGRPYNGITSYLTVNFARSPRPTFSVMSRYQVILFLGLY